MRLYRRELESFQESQLSSGTLTTSLSVITCWFQRLKSCQFLFNRILVDEVNGVRKEKERLIAARERPADLSYLSLTTIMDKPHQPLLLGPANH